MLSEIVSILMMAGVVLASLVVWSVAVAVPTSYVMRRHGHGRLERLVAGEFPASERAGAAASGAQAS